MKKLYHDSGTELWEFFIENVQNPCGCACDSFNYEYDGEDIWLTCSCCGKRIYGAVTKELRDELLQLGKWIGDKSPSDYTILVDIDDVIEDLCSAWVKWLNNQWGTDVKREDITDWDVSKFFPTLSRDQVFAPLHNDYFWWTIEPKPGAAEYLKKLIEEGYNVYLCTSTDYRNVKPKYEAIVSRYFPFIPWRKVIVAHDKQMINADFLIDDGIHNLEGGSYHKILMSAPHNADYDAEKNGMSRVNDWEEVYNLIKRMAN